jgi:hypothetical protein
MADLFSVGLNFGMWAINKSPLIIGAALDPGRLNKASLEILLKKEIIAINQDSLAKQAQLVRRNTEDEWGTLSIQM